MTDDQITEARAYINLGLSVSGTDLPAREARAQARRAAAEVLTELRRLKATFEERDAERRNFAEAILRVEQQLGFIRGTLSVTEADRDLARDTILNNRALRDEIARLDAGIPAVTVTKPE